MSCSRGSRGTIELIVLEAFCVFEPDSKRGGWGVNVIVSLIVAKAF